MDYSRKKNWVYITKREKRIHPVDVFYVYPTVYVHPNKSKNYMNTNSPFYRALATMVSFWQVQPFVHTGNVFIPHYRQAGMESLKMEAEEFVKVSERPYFDVRDAFLYYMEHLNGGRPFILAGHSQGSAMLLNLLRREFADGKYDRQFVAAYLPGYSVVKDDFIIYPHLKLAKKEDDLGVIITYNSSAKGLKLISVVREGAYCVNPLDWSHRSGYVGKEKNEGSVLFEYKKISISKKNFTGAYCDKKTGALIIDDDALNELLHIKIGFLNRILLSKNSLHMLDIALFHRNLQYNAKKRADKFLESYGKFY